MRDADGSEIPYLKRCPRTANLVYECGFPVRLQAIVEKRTFSRSMGVKDRRQVRAIHARIDAEFDAIVKQARHQHSGRGGASTGREQRHAPDYLRDRGPGRTDHAPIRGRMADPGGATWTSCPGPAAWT